MATPTGTHMQISTTLNFTTNVIDDNGAYRTNIVPPNNVLPRNTDLYVRARHRNSENAYSDWGTTKQFRIKAYDRWLLYTAIADSTYTHATGVIVDNEGNVITTSIMYITKPFYISFRDYPHGVIIKYNSEGAFIWAKYTDQCLFNEIANAFPNENDSSNNYIITGNIRTNNAYAYGSGFNPDQALVLKLNKDGTILWNKVISTGYTDFKAVALDSSNNIYLVGNLQTSSNPYLIKCSGGNGDIIFQRQLSFTGVFTRVAIFGSYAYLVGYVYLDSTTTRGYVAKLGVGTGNIIWQKYIEFTNSYNNVLNGISISSTGDLYLAGYASNVFESSDSNAGIILKLNSDGVCLWTKYTTVPAILAMLLWDTSGIYAIGYRVISSVNKPFVVKFDESGTQSWAAYLTNTGAFVNIKADGLNSSNIFIVGYASNVSNTLATIKTILCTISPNVPTAGALPSISMISWAVEAPNSNVKTLVLTNLTATWLATSFEIVNYSFAFTAVDVSNIGIGKSTYS